MVVMYFSHSEMQPLRNADCLQYGLSLRQQNMEVDELYDPVSAARAPACVLLSAGSGLWQILRCVNGSS